jgi:hypothetical protein
MNRKQLWLLKGAHCEVPAVTGVFTDHHFNNIISDGKFTSRGARGDSL